MDRPADRIESIKAAGIGLSIAGVVWGAISWLNLWLIGTSFLQPLLSSIPPLQSLATSSFFPAEIGLPISAALFAITYRYVVRDDNNPHLGPGAVGAFGIVRVCAQLETGWQLNSQLAPLIVTAAESCAVFAIVAAGLDWCMQNGWLQTTGQD